MTQATTSGKADRFPQDIEAECALLGSAILDGRVMDEVGEIIEVSDFWKPTHRTIYAVMVELHATARPIEVLTIKGTLEDRNKLEAVGGVDYLIELCESVPSALSAAHYARRVRDQARKRTIIEVCDAAIRSAAESPEDPQAIAEHLQAAMATVGETASTSTVTSIGAEVAARYDWLHRLAEGEEQQQAIKTGLADIDRMTGGLCAGQLIILAATPGGGKTALGTQLALHSATRQSAPVGVFSLEMTRSQLAERLLAHESGVPLDQVRGVKPAQAESFSAMASGVGKLTDVPIYPVDHRNLTVEKVRSSARWLKSRYGIGMVIVDYLQLMATSGQRSRSRNDEVAEQSRALKLLALELEIPVLCLSQLNRSSSRDNRRPRLCDLRDSGAIEQDADVVMFLHNPNRQEESPAPGFEPDEKDLELIIAKQRQGPTGCVRLRFDGARQRFKNLTHVGNMTHAWGGAEA